MNKTPKLRFKEFSGDWEIKKLGELGEFKKTYSFSRSLEGEGNYKHIHYGDIHMNYKGIISKDKLIPSIDIPSDDNYEFIQDRDIIFADASEDRKDLGKVAVVRNIEGNILSGLHTLCFRPKEDLNSEFFLSHSLNKEYLKFMYTRGNGAKVLGISKSNLSEYKFLAPSKEEQEKIASFFSLIDDKISLQGEKVEALKDYKKGMMQKIFSRELRFKDDEGRDYPEWEEKKLGDIGIFKTSSVDKLINENEELVYLVNYMDVYKHIDINKDSIMNLMKVSAKDAQIENNNLIKGDILFTPSSETPDDIGHSIVIFEDLPKTLYSYHLVRFRPEIKLNLLYSHYFCNIDSVRSQIVKFATGSTRFTVSINEFSKVKVNIPSYNEQKKIGEFLNNIDLKLRKEQEKLDYLNEYKKGLLQQMFV